MKLQSVCFKKWWIGVVCCLSFAGPALRVNRPHAGDNQFWLTGLCTLLRCGLCTENTHVRRLLRHICVWGSCVVLFHFFSFFLPQEKKLDFLMCLMMCLMMCLTLKSRMIVLMEFPFTFFLKTHLTNSQTSLVSAHGCSGCYPLLSKHMHMVAPSETMSKQHEASRWNQPFMLRLALTAPVYDFTIIYTATTAL